ncbi:MAG: hypothetical protein ACHQF4_02445 [Sphingobacteriales bacterium]|jgi:hypothetical protein
MKSTELRIGNYVTSKAWNGCHRIDGIQATDDGFELTIGDYIHKFQDGMYVDIKPIPLTPELLEKCGFEERNHCEDWFIKLPDTDTIISYRRNQLRICPVNSMACLYTDCLYLHTLQNYYHAISGEELQITL